MANDIVINSDDSPGDIYFVDPFAVELPEDQPEESAVADDIVEMAISLFAHGQRKAVQCRKVGEHRLVLDHGLVRTLAARLIRSGFDYTNRETKEAIQVKDKRFKLKIVLTLQGRARLRAGDAVTSQQAENVT